MNKDKITKISKLLSFVLRHNPQDIGLVLDENGWADVQELITKAKPKISFTFEELKEVVVTSDKQRFALSPDGKQIRANQGHSIDVDLQLTEIKPPDELFHGTAVRFVKSIMSEGLKKMDRHHVHMYSEENMDKAKDTGARHQKGTGAVVLTIHAKEMYDLGYKFYRSANNVYLTDSVPSEFLTI